MLLRETQQTSMPSIQTAQTLTRLIPTPATSTQLQATTPTSQQTEDNRLFRSSDYSTKPYTAVVKIDYTVNNGAFSSSDFVIINI